MHIDKLNKKHKEVIIMGHSSGGTTAINYAKNDKIKKLILLDGVDTRFINKETKNKLHNLQNLNSILYIKANKSYNITYDPYGLPFIPILSINNDNDYNYNDGNYEDNDDKDDNDNDTDDNDRRRRSKR